MQEVSRMPARRSWGRKIYEGEAESCYSQDFHVRLVGTRERAVSKIKQQIRDAQGVREVAALIAVHGVDHSELQDVFAWIGKDILRLPDEEDYERIVGQTQEVSTDAPEEPPVSETSALPTASAFSREREPEPVQSAGRITHVGEGALRRAVIPDCQDVVWVIHEYPGMAIKSLARVRVARLGGNPDLDDDAFRKAMRDANAAGKAGYVRRIGDQFWPLDYPLETAA